MAVAVEIRINMFYCFTFIHIMLKTVGLSTTWVFIRPHYG